jgi:hypothetical protein
MPDKLSYTGSVFFAAAGMELRCSLAAGAMWLSRFGHFLPLLPSSSPPGLFASHRPLTIDRPRRSAHSWHLVVIICCYPLIGVNTVNMCYYLPVVLSICLSQRSHLSHPETHWATWCHLMLIGFSCDHSILFESTRSHTGNFGAPRLHAITSNSVPLLFSSLATLTHYCSQARYNFAHC